jgi:phosphatidate cytidylyltransferase
MKDRLYSAAALLLVLTTAILLDHAFEVLWFSATLIVVTISIGTLECYALFRLRGRPLSPSAEPAPMDDVRNALLAVACIGLPGAILLALQLQEHGLRSVLYLVAVAKMVDNGALLVGRLLGRHKLAPKISPAKTVEGVLGGLCTGLLTAFLLGPHCTNGSPTFFLIFGLTIGILSVIGDLVASLVKRRAGVKDSGSLLPGIGGVLDLMDSVLLSAPVAYFLLVVR